VLNCGLRRHRLPPRRRPPPTAQCRGSCSSARRCAARSNRCSPIRMLSSLRSGIAHPLSAPIVHSQKSGGMIPVPFGSWSTAPAPVLARRLLLGLRYAGPSCRLPKR
jgi:hypothetical protein